MIYLQGWKLIKLFFLCTIISTELLPQSRPKELDIPGRVQILTRILKENPNLKIFVIDGFEGERPWKIHRGISFLNETAFIPKTPEIKGFDLEFQTIKSSEKNYHSFYSLQVLSNFEIPKKGKIEIIPPRPFPIPEGIPVRLVAWVYSEGNDLDLYLILSQKKSKEIQINLGRIDFTGWRRLEVPMTIPSRNIRYHLSFSEPFLIKSLKITGTSRQKKGNFFICLDQLFIIYDTEIFKYSGSEIKDNWGFDF